MCKAVMEIKNEGVLEGEKKVEQKEILILLMQ